MKTICASSAARRDRVWTRCLVWSRRRSTHFTRTTKIPLRLLPDSGLHGLAREYQTGDLCQLVRVTTARTLAEYGAEFYAGTPALTVNSFGNGRAYYIACRTGQDFLNDFLGVLIRDLGLRNLDTELPAGVTVSLRCDASTGREFFFVQNFSDSAVEIALPGSFTNVETGKACGETLSASGLWSRCAESREIKRIFQ